MQSNDIYYLLSMISLGMFMVFDLISHIIGKPEKQIFITFVSDISIVFIS
jgi:predicted metal-dependent phosphotriesterase family hydrolase